MRMPALGIPGVFSALGFKLHGSRVEHATFRPMNLYPKSHSETAVSGVSSNHNFVCGLDERLVGNMQRESCPF